MTVNRDDAQQGVSSSPLKTTRRSLMCVSLVSTKTGSPAGPFNGRLNEAEANSPEVNSPEANSPGCEQSGSEQSGSEQSGSEQSGGEQSGVRTVPIPWEVV